jgi:signal transduction histidine kinase
MPSPDRSVTARLGEFFAVDDEWERPRPTIGASDITLALAAVVAGLGLLELTRSVGVLDHTTQPRWVQWLATASVAVLLLFRRRYPLSVGVLAALHMFVVGVTMPAVMGLLALQVSYFIAYFSAAAWARERRSMLVVVGGVIALMFVWVAWQLALGSGIDQIVASTRDVQQRGWLPPVAAAVILTIVINAVYFGGAVVAGQIAWRGARQRARLAEQMATIAGQAEGLRRRAVLDERLRIARELHDVVGHHVSVIGIQAGAARRVLDTDRDAAAAALARIEASSREGVAQMRQLLGTLREMEEGEDLSSAGPTGTGRAPEPGLADLPTLTAERTSAGLPTTFELVESRPGAGRDLSAPLGLSLYRIAQEALANTATHSTATQAGVVVRVDDAGPHPHVEVEVVDNGRPRSGTSGSGLGQIGIRERAASHRGEVDIGPRAIGGYRVRVRMPLGDADVRG